MSSLTSDMKKLSEFIIIIIHFIPILAFCQELRFQQFTMQDGLSNDGTYWLESIIQDREGFMWFTTFNGLNRFDGKHFKHYQYSQDNPSGLGNNLTTAICEAEDGRIWAGTNSGIYIFDSHTEEFEHLQHDPSNPHSLCGNDINFIHKDRDGNMWVGTAAQGVCRWSPKTGHFNDLGGYFNDGLVFFQQKDGTIWVGSMNGLHRKTTGKDEFHLAENWATSKPVKKRYASDIVELADGNLMVSSYDNGLWVYDPHTTKFTDLTASYHSEFLKGPACLLEDESGKIWMGAVGEVQSYDPLTGQFKAYRHDDNDPASLPMFKLAFGYQDAAGSLWFVTSGGGVVVSHSPHHPFEQVGDIEAGEVVRLDENRLLINGFEKLAVFDTRLGKLVPSEIPGSLLNASTLSIALSGKNELWVQQWNTDHIKVFNLESLKIRQIAGSVPFLKSDKHGRIWTCLKYYNEAQNAWVEVHPAIEGLPSSYNLQKEVVDIYFGDKDTVWLATNAGIFQFDMATMEGRKYRLYPHDSLSIDVIHKIYPGQEGRFYLSTSNGMSMYAPFADGFLNFNESNGMLHNQLTSVVEDAHGNAWLTTPKGLQKLDLTTGAFTDFGINDGLPSIHFNYQRAYRDDNGYLYCSAEGKLIRFHPDSLKAKTYTAPVHLLDFFLNHQSVKTGGKDALLKKRLRFTQNIQLSHDQADFGFSFVMPVFYKANEVQYFYQLYPYEKDWQSVGLNNEVHYTNMSPGSYTFRVKAKTADGFWSPNEASVTIRISPPFYRTWWAYLFYLIATGSILFGIRHFELRRQSMKSEALRLQELDSLKSRLYTNITHEFRTPLTVIMGMVDNIRGHQQERRLIQRNSKNLLRLINQLLDLSKLDSGSLKMDMVQGDIVNYLQYLTESFYSMAQEKKIRLTFYSEEKKLVMDFDEVKIQHIVYNLLSNAIKFTQAEGKVVFHVRKIERNAEPWLQMKVTDNGSGISKDDLAHIFDRFYQADASHTRQGEGTGIGLALTKELVGMMGGTISVTSEVGEGTTFLIILPVKREDSTAQLETEFETSQTLAPELIPDAPILPVRPMPSPVEEGKEKDSLLIIEDNPDVITYIESLLEKDFVIETARNGQEGIDKAFETVPDIIISDVMMPEKDGYEVCHILKNDECTSHIPIILLTAKASPEDRVEGLREGADAYLTKPFNKEELLIRLEKLVELRRALQAKYSDWRLVTGDSSAQSPVTSYQSPVATLEDIFLQKLYKVVEDRLDDTSLGVVHLCHAVHLSNMQVNRKLKALTGKTPSLFIRSIRLQKGMELLKTTDLNVSEIAYQVGFSDPNYFSRAFSEEFGYPPSVVRN